MRISELLNEDAENGKFTIKSWYDSNSSKLYNINDGYHHSNWLVEFLPDEQFTKIYGSTKQQYINSYEHFGRLVPKFDDNLVSSFYDSGWIRLGFEYENKNKEEFYANGQGLKNISRALYFFIKLVSKRGFDIKTNVHIQDDAPGGKTYHITDDRVLNNFLKFSIIKNSI
jgi:hypothetical protein